MQPIQRNDDVSGVSDCVQVLGHSYTTGTAGFLNRGGRIAEFARGRDHCHGLDQPLGGVGIRQRAKHLETDLGQAVAESAEVQFFEDHIGGAAVGRGAGCAHLGGDERIGGLNLVAGIPAPGDARHVHWLAVGPHPANAGDSTPCRPSSASDPSPADRPSGTTFAQRHREGGEVEVFGGRDFRPAALAAALAGGVDLLAEVRGPDDVAADAHPAEQSRDHRAFDRGGDAQAVEPRALDALGWGEGRYDPIVDHRPDGRADETADGRARETEDGARQSPPSAEPTAPRTRVAMSGVSKFGVRNR